MALQVCVYFYGVCEIAAVNSPWLVKPGRCARSYSLVVKFVCVQSIHPFSISVLRIQIACRDHRGHGDYRLRRRPAPGFG